MNSYLLHYIYLPVISKLFLTIVDNDVLGDNNLNGSIPIELGQIKTLQQIKLGNNTLEGSIPSELGKIGTLEILDLGMYDYSYLLYYIYLPIYLILNHLFYFCLGNNSLIGQIPTQFANLQSLLVIDFGMCESSILFNNRKEARISHAFFPP